MKTRLLIACIIISNVFAAAPAAAIPPPSLLVSIFGSDSCYMDVFDNGRAVLGQGVSWNNSDDASHRIEQKQGFWNFKLAGDADLERKMKSAGRFDQRCDSESYSSDDAIKVPVSARRTTGTKFEIRWALSSASDKLRYRVRYRVGSGSYKSWKSGTSARSAVFRARDGKTYYFQARTVKAGKATGWSPDKKFTA